MGWIGCFLPIEARGRRSRSTCRFRSSWRFGGAVAHVSVPFGPLRCESLLGSTFVLVSGSTSHMRDILDEYTKPD
jgi:hypothetical protein